MLLPCLAPPSKCRHLPVSMSYFSKSPAMFALLNPSSSPSISTSKSPQLPTNHSYAKVLSSSLRQDSSLPGSSQSSANSSSGSTLPPPVSLAAPRVWRLVIYLSAFWAPYGGLRLSVIFGTWTQVVGEAGFLEGIDVWRSLHSSDPLLASVPCL